MANEVAKKEATTEERLRFAANKLTEVYITDITNVNSMVGVESNEASKRCAVNLIFNLCSEHGVATIQSLPREQLISMIQFVMINGLDINAGQVFLDVRKGKDGSIRTIKATPQGSAYEIMVNRWGVNVKQLHQARIVHEGDEFQLPQYEGLKVTPLIHKPTLAGLDGKAIAVYYIVEKKDGTLDYLIATREGVAKNLMAQILNAALKDRENVNREELMARMDGKSLNELLTDTSLRKYISPAYRSPSSREQMIITKMKKNALLHYTRDLGGETNMDKATKTALEDADQSDMINTENVVASVEGDEAENPSKPAPKIQNFEVEDEGDETPNEGVENPAKQAPISLDKETGEVEENPAKPIEKEEEKGFQQASIFDMEDL